MLGYHSRLVRGLIVVIIQTLILFVFVRLSITPTMSGSSLVYLLPQKKE